MLTGLQDVHVATNAFRRGAIDYLLKPFDRGQLLGAVDRALEHIRLLKQNAAYRHNLEDIVSARTSRLRSTMQDLERSYDFTLEAMGDALDLRDAETQGHSRRVTAYTISLAREVGLNADQLHTIARGAFLHDIGKIATPDAILLKPGKLTPEEIEIMRKHCACGYEMVTRDPLLAGGRRARVRAPGDLRRQWLPARPARRGNPPRRAHLRHRRHVRRHHLGPALPQGPQLRRGALRDPPLQRERSSIPPSSKYFLPCPSDLWRDLRREVEEGYANPMGITLH